MTDKKIKTGVIGVGHLGRFHVQQLQTIAEAEIVGVFDTSSEQLKKITDEFGVKPFTSIEALIAEADAVSVVVPTEYHYEVAAQALSAGCHVFVEKPITHTLDEADQLLNLAKESDRLIQVGHIERLNPAIRALDKYNLEPMFIEAHRLAPFSARGTDVPVILDLMIHDIDVVLAMVKSPIKEIRANGVSIITDSADIATARLEFENGAVANLTASRISQRQMRKMRLFQEQFYIGIDFLQQLAEVYSLAEPGKEPQGAEVTMPYEYKGQKKLIAYEKPAVDKYNALNMELGNFVRSVAGLDIPAVDGYAARSALDIAIRIHDIIAKQ